MTTFPSQADDGRDPSADLILAQAVIDGDQAAIELFYREYRPVLERTLLGRADSRCARSGVPEVLDEVLAECVAPLRSPRRRAGEAYCLLERYVHPVRSTAPPGLLLPWMRTVVVHRFLDWVKKNCPLGPVEDDSDNEQGAEGERASAMAGDSEVTALVVASLRHGFHSAAEQQPRGVLALLLTLVHGVQGRHLARALGVDGANVTVPKQRALAIIQDESLIHLRRTDPLLEVTWEDMMSVLAVEKDLVVSLLAP